MIKKLILTLVRPRLEYAPTIWSPSKTKHLRKLDRIQRAAAKLSPNLRELSYKERLQILALTTLEQKRERDLIAV